jgi:hypothetical protein
MTIHPRASSDGKMTVANPLAPGRGTFHIDHDGSAARIDNDGHAAGDFPATGLDDDGVGSSSMRPGTPCGQVAFG